MAANRIPQGADGLDRLYTVRPRNAKSVTKKRGTPSSIRFNIPDDLKSNPNAYTTGLPAHTVSAFSDAVNEEGLGFINFIAQSVSYSIQEKSQIMHTFGGQEAVYFYGRAPVMVQLSGTIVDDLDNDQFAKFMGLYQNFLRGSQASKEYSYVTLSLNNAVFQGSFMNISIQQNSDRDTDITFSAQFLAKTFTLASSDTAFADGEGKFTSNLKVRDPDPTITRENVQAIIDANNRAIRLKPEKDEVNDSSNTLTNPNTGFFGGIPKSFGKLPTLEGLLGFSAADITKFFGVITDTIGNITAPFTDLVAQIDAFAKSAIGLVEAIEEGIDDVINMVDSVSNQVFGAVDSIDDAITKICSFPDSLSAKLGSIGQPGGAPLPIAGSENISSSDGAALLTLSSNSGAARGTPEGDAAKISLSTSSNQEAFLTPSLGTGGGGNSLVPGLNPGEEELPPELDPNLPPDLNPGLPPLLPTTTRVGG